MTKDIVEISHSDLMFLFSQIENITGQEISDAERTEIQQKILETNRKRQKNIDPDVFIYKKLSMITAYSNLIGIRDSDIDSLKHKYRKRVESSDD